MTSRQFQTDGEPRGGNRLSRMVALSAVIHVVLIATIMLSAIRVNPTVPPPPAAYTVSLIDPAALGTNLPGGGGKLSESGGAPKPAAPRPQPAAEVKPAPVAKKEEPKEPPAPPKEAKETVKLPDKEKPVEKPPVKPQPEKAKVEEKKPETKKPEAKPEPQPTTIKDTKKPESKPEPQPKPEEQKAEPPKTTPPGQSPEERDQQILTALNRIKTKVDKEAVGNGTGSSTTTSATEGPGASIKGSGPATLGGAPGAGGGGTVRGLEYIMYTEQVKRRVKENWIVAERRDRLNAIVRFNVQPDGEISALEMLQSSGDPTFDQSVLRAVNKANPLPPPPEAYREEFVSQKVEVTFRSEEQIN